MVSPRENEPNPYEPPASDLGISEVVDPSAIDPGLIKKFRDQIHALGALWIIIGSFSAVLGGVALVGDRNVRGILGPDVTVLLIIVAIFGSIWLVLGVLTCLKQMWAVYAGLVLCYLSLFAQVLSLAICPAILMIAVILQAHRVIKWANQMHAAGISLTAGR